MIEAWVLLVLCNIRGEPLDGSIWVRPEVVVAVEPKMKGCHRIYTAGGKTYFVQGTVEELKARLGR